MFEKKLTNYKNLIDEELNKTYNDGPVLLREPINYILMGGKRLRPILCMLTSDSFGGNKKNSLCCSISIELLHIFSLVHDDIMDDDVLRHGKNTIHDKWDIPIGILAGDAILALAFKQLNQLDNNIKEKFNSALIAICEGQALDIEYQGKNNTSLDEYIAMIDLKTSHIIGLCAELGAVISHLKDEDVFKMKSFGKLIGRAFQIQDDLLEATLSQEVMGKSLDSDIILNKKTFLMIKANEKCPKEISELLLTIKHNSSFEIKQKYLDILNKNNLIVEAECYIENIFNDATNILNSMKLYNNSLYDFMDYIKGRKC